MFRALEPKIHLNNVYNDVTRFVTNIKIFYAEEKQISWAGRRHWASESTRKTPSG